MCNVNSINKYHMGLLVYFSICLRFKRHYITILCPIGHLSTGRRRRSYWKAFSSPLAITYRQKCVLWVLKWPTVVSDTRRSLADSAEQAGLSRFGPVPIGTCPQSDEGEKKRKEWLRGGGRGKKGRRKKKWHFFFMSAKLSSL